MNKLLSTSPLFAAGGLTFIRVIIGAFLMYHGWEVLDKNKMNEYIAGNIFRNSSSPAFMAYLGKASELVAGFLMAIGFFTRIAAIIIICTFMYITFFIGNGKIWFEDQYPLLFALFGWIFFFLGPGKWSLDHVFFDKKKLYERSKIVNS